MHFGVFPFKKPPWAPYVTSQKNHPFPEAGDSLERLTNGMVKAWGRGILQPSKVEFTIEKRGLQDILAKCHFDIF
jgi:hypothetical protein